MKVNMCQMQSLVTSSVLAMGMAVRNVHLTGIVKVVPSLVCAMTASKSFTP